jgi:hypothetical protein
MIDALPSDLFALILGHVNDDCGWSVLFLAPQACRRWRRVCCEHLVARVDLSWATSGQLPWTKSNPLTDMAMHSMLGRFHGISHLTLAYCCRLSETSLARLGSPHLLVLRLEGSLNLTNAALRLIAGHSPNMVSVSLGHCAQISDEGVLDLAASCRRLTDVDLQYCSLISDHGIVALSRCTLLSSLNLRLVRHVTDNCLKSASSLAKLVSLDLYGCQNITDTGLASLAVGRCVHLENVNVSHCSKVTSKGLRALQSAFPRLKCDALGCVEQEDAMRMH